MQTAIPDYFIALMKQHGGMLNDEQARRATLAVSEVLDATLVSTQEKCFFSMVPSYLRPRKQLFFARIGSGSRDRQSKPATKQLMVRLQLTSPEEAETVLRAYFRAIRTVVAPNTAISLTRVLPRDLEHLYATA
jgi:uncharacterized protein (DUF2267 family)